MRFWQNMHPMMGSALVMLTLVGGLALAVRLGWVPGAAISLEMTLQPARHQGTAILLPLRLVLHNPSGRIQSLPPQNACKIFRWFILDQTSAFIQSAAEQNCGRAMIDRAMRPWEEASEDFTLRLDGKRFTRGQPYHLIIRFWGLDQQQSFTP